MALSTLTAGVRLTSKNPLPPLLSVAHGSSPTGLGTKKESDSLPYQGRQQCSRPSDFRRRASTSMFFYQAGGALSENNDQDERKNRFRVSLTTCRKK